MMDLKFRYLFVFLLFACGMSAQAQVTVEQKVDSVGILIGQQTAFRLSVTAPKGSNIQFPALQTRQYLVPGVEILKIESDTADAEDNLSKISKVYTLTSFDEHLYAIPGQKVRVNGKEYTANTAALKVVTIEVDTTNENQFFPPKGVQGNPFLWSEWSPLFWLSLLFLLLCMAGVYLYSRLRENKPVITPIRIIKKIPAHQKALRAINQLKAEKMPASEDEKAYYTQLTDTLRQYIHDRFGFNAKEMTTSQIIDNLRSNGDTAMIGELRELFETADLVKFARHKALIDENDLNLVNAVNFIDKTKIEGERPTEERIVPKLSEDDRKTQKNRLTAKTLLYATGIVALALLAHVVYHACLLLI